MLQGGIATGYALSLAIVRDTKTERNAASLIGYIGMVMAIAPMLAPILGGFIDTALGWRANFYLFAVSGFCCCWCAGSIWVKQDHPHSRRRANRPKPC
jgi:DHA1 family bicyclomycin/chloramphenicol resistance-like MFS transporter